MDEKKNINNVDINNDTSSLNFSQNQEQYIHSLEMAVQLLQREVEHLRSQINPEQPPKKQVEVVEPLNLNGTSPLFHDCTNGKELHEKLVEMLSEKYSILESEIYLVSSDMRLIPFAESEIASTINTQVKKFEEEGIIDWAVEKKIASVIPNLDDSSAPTSFILTPLFLRGAVIGLFIGKTSQKHTNYSIEELNQLTNISKFAAVALDNIRSAEEISRINRRLNALNNQIMQSSKLASIGEIAGSIAMEIENPLQIILANLKLIENNVGDTKRRIQIIKEQIEKINDIVLRLASISSSYSGEMLFKNINLCELIDEVLLFSSSQLQRDGIKIDKEYECLDCRIQGIKPQIEQIFLNLLLNARDTMPDGGTITIGVFRLNPYKSVITIADTGSGINQNDLPYIFEPDFNSKAKSTRSSFDLFLIKNIIQQHKGTISVYSEEDKGTTFKIILPTV